MKVYYNQEKIARGLRDFFEIFCKRSTEGYLIYKNPP